MANRIKDALLHAADVAEQEAELWEARRVRELGDGETERAEKHAERKTQALAMRAKIHALWAAS